MTSRPVRDLEVLNFKSFSSLKLALGRLTVLTGTNSSGKSTVIQAMALLEQSRDQEPAGLILNGPLVELGTFEDLLFDRVGEDLSSDVAVSVGFRPTTGRWLRFAGGSLRAVQGIDADGLRILRGQLPWV